MSNIVNLRSARKILARQAAERVASENRSLHGRTKAERERDRLRHAQADAALDNAKLDQPASPEND